MIDQFSYENCLTDKLYWGLELEVTSSFSNWGCILKGCFERGMF